MTDIDVPDWVVEQAAMAVERSHHPEWSDEQFGVWWNFDPLFCERKTSWNGYENMTRKEKALATARIAITAALGAWVVPESVQFQDPNGKQWWNFNGPESCRYAETLLWPKRTLYTLRQEKPDVLP